MEIKLNNLSKRFGDKVVLDNISTSFKARDVNALIAPNGIGKTTLVSILAGFLTPDGGDVTFAGLKQADVALVLGGDKNLYMKNTPAENVFYFGVLKGLSGARIKQNIALFSAYFPTYQTIKDKLCEQLSHGQKRLVAIFSALVSEAKSVIIDEADAGLDKKHVEQLVDLLRSIKQECLVVVVSHDYNFVENVADKFFFFRDKKIECIDCQKRSLLEVYNEIYPDDIS